MQQAVDRIMEQAVADNLMNVANIVVMSPEITGIDPNVVSGALELSLIGRKESGVAQ